MHELNPITDPRWRHFVNQRSDSSVFHTKEWLEAIHKTYGYQPVAFAKSAGSEITDGLVFCKIDSWLTGKRLVSLPFSDHCQPLATGVGFTEILHSLTSQRRVRGQKYIELRPIDMNMERIGVCEMVKSSSFSFHRINLLPDAKTIYGKFHESCIRRKIKRAEREALRHESGRSEELLKKFRHLLLLTRRRHKLPPQPSAWFDNIVRCLGDAVTIHVASKDETPVASILTLAYRKKLVYKYGCSDGQFSNMGGTPMLFWKAIQRAKDDGIEEFDLGRSDYDEPGLIAFKEHLGATSSELSYYRDPAAAMKMPSPKSSTSPSSLIREAMVRLPDPVLAGVGQLLYRHMG